MSLCDSQGQILSCKREDAGSREISEPSNPWDAPIKRQKFHLAKCEAIMGLSLCSAENKWEIGCVCQGHEGFPGQAGAGDLSLPKGAALRNGSVQEGLSAGAFPSASPYHLRLLLLCQEDSWGIQASSLNFDPPGAFVHCKGPSLGAQKVPLRQQVGTAHGAAARGCLNHRGNSGAVLADFFK